MRPPPTVSVVMVFHRDTPFFRPAVRSVVDQTLRDWELILVDNGARISLEALGPEFSSDERIRWVRLETNRGIPAGHNAGIAASRGEFVALLDYDDLMLPQRLEKQVSRLRERPDLGLVSSLARRIDAVGTVIGEEFSLLQPAEQLAYTAYAAPVVTPAYAGRREVFAQLPYREVFSWAADFDFLARAVERWSLAGVPDVLLHYRWHDGQTTQQKRAAIEQNCAVIRLLTARRRAGRAEEFNELTARLMEPAPLPVESCRWGAERALSEGFFSLAAYHARRMIVLRRDFATLTAASKIAARAVRVARGADQQQVLRMFFRGPVKALRLTPARLARPRAPSSG